MSKVVESDLMALQDALARAESWASNSRVRPSVGDSRAVATSLLMEVMRLQAVVRRAQQESELIEHKGSPALAVPYWFVKA